METEAKGNWANRKVSDSGQAVSGARKKGMPKWAKIGLLMVGLILVITESIVFAVSLVGWFDDKKKVEISSEYVCGAGEVPEFINVDAPGYEQLAAEKKSFVIFVDQGGCATADGLRERLMEYAKKKGIRINRIMFSEMKETTLHDKIKFYPSVAIISDGEVVAWLRADLAADAEIYNDYDALEKWLGKWL